MKRRVVCLGAGVVELRVMRIPLVILALVCMAARGEGNADFARYQVILDRMPFGNEPSPEALAAAAAQAAPPRDPFTKNLKMCAVTRNLLSGKLQVGLTDVASKKNYFLGVGESEDGIEIVEADYEKEKALLRKNGEEAWLGMNDVSVVSAPKAPTTAMARPPSRMDRLVASASRTRSTTNAETAPRVLREERLTPKLTGEALTKHLQSYQMDLIRAGGEKGPPLPMELTPEMDAQLVSEGVLPPLQ